VRGLTDWIGDQGFILVIGSKDNSPNPFQSFDLVELGERVKYMNGSVLTSLIIMH
jgi:hypothetical protein